jgi:hypothetical protein
MMKKSWFRLSFVLLFLTLNVWAKPIKTGKWKFELRTTHAAIPFIIDFSYDKDNRLQALLLNGEEKIKLDDIAYVGDDIFIPLQTYEISLELEQQGDKMLSGYLVRKNKNPIVKTPVIGAHGHKTRYPGKKRKALIDLNGKWTLELKDQEDVKSPAVGNFKQKGNKITGSILTPTGDYRYMEGVVQGDAFEAASFDGVYNYIFRGTVKEGKLQAEIL